MSWQEVALVLINMLQVVALTWIAAHQAGAHREVRKLNGAVSQALQGVQGSVEQLTAESAREPR